MTQDFAKKPRTQRPRAKQKQAPSSNIPGWVWLFTGGILGAFVMFLVYLSDLSPTQGERNSTKSATAKTSTDKATPKPRFDFYELLKESEVVVNVPESDSSANQVRKEYILQVGSFRKEEDAERLRVELILLNLDAKITEVKGRKGELWNRVTVGPFNSTSTLSKARSTLVSNNYTPITLTRKL